MQSEDQDETQPTVNVQCSFVTALIMFLVSVICFCVSLHYFSRETSNSRIIAGLFLAVSVFALLGFVHHQARTTEKRVVEVQLMARPTTWPLFLGTFFREAGTLGVRVYPLPNFVSLVDRAEATFLDSEIQP